MAVRFSARTAWDTSENGLAQAMRECREAGVALIDLTLSNPTLCKFDYDMNRVLGALVQPAAMTYEANPRGILSARTAVAAYYADHNVNVVYKNVILTTSTSEAYSFLFCLLCDPGDSVLVMQPGYPLFDFLADLDDVRRDTYPLFEDFGWWIDFAELERRIGERTRAIVVVHPNNPTGHATSAPERARLEEICTRRGLALIVDEVFLDYGLLSPVQSFAAGDHACLKFIVSGISKIAALPQMKVGWIVCCGPDAERQQAMERLEIVADTFLSMNAPAQHALPFWLQGRSSIQAQILARVRENLALLAEGAFEVIPVEAGWSAVVKLPRSLGDRLAERLVRDAAVVVHPGSFYGLPGSNLIVVSLIVEPEMMVQGIKKLDAWCESQKLTNPGCG